MSEEGKKLRCNQSLTKLPVETGLVATWLGALAHAYSQLHTRGEGGGGTLIFSSYVGSSSASTVHQKISGISST